MSHDSGLQFSTERINDAVVLRLSGEIDLSRSSEFRVQLAQIQQDKPAHLVVDLTGVPYMDSSGVATLVEAMQVCRRYGGGLTLCGLQERVLSIFEIAHLDTVFKIVATSGEAAP